VGEVEVHPVDSGRWPDLVSLFGPSGAYSGCWCMWWRIPGGEFSRNGNAGNRRALEELAQTNQPLGLLAYVDGEPVGWATVAPRPAYGRILRSPALKPDQPDDDRVWSVPCFFIGRGHRGTGIATALLRHAVTHARARHATLLEGYPVDNSEPRPAAELFSGTLPMFTAAGFTVHKRPPTGHRVVVRKALRARAAR
jgi:GNAT superfamily N-acetyltransferase